MRRVQLQNLIYEWVANHYQRLKKTFEEVSKSLKKKPLIKEELGTASNRHFHPSWRESLCERSCCKREKKIQDYWCLEEYVVTARPDEEWNVYIVQYTKPDGKI